jgi:hypothetical protein
MGVAYFHAVLTVSKTLLCLNHAICALDATKLSAMLLGPPICTSIISYGLFVYKLATVARGTARVIAV